MSQRTELRLDWARDRNKINCWVIWSPHVYPKAPTREAVETAIRIRALSCTWTLYPDCVERAHGLLELVRQHDPDAVLTDTTGTLPERKRAALVLDAGPSHKQTTIPGLSGINYGR